MQATPCKANRLTLASRGSKINIGQLVPIINDGLPKS
jgi:hypothetical protein